MDVNEELKFFVNIFLGGSGPGGGVGLGFRVDVDREVKFLWKFKKH